MGGLSRTHFRAGARSLGSYTRRLEFSSKNLMIRMSEWL